MVKTYYMALFQKVGALQLGLFLRLIIFLLLWLFLAKETLSDPATREMIRA